jgi:hypothetical protein
MISNQDSINLSPFMAIYDIVVPKDMLLQINELVDFSYVLKELKTKYCLDNGRNSMPPIRIFNYLCTNPSLKYPISMWCNAPNTICCLNISSALRQKLW